MEEVFLPAHDCWFSLNNSEMVRALTVSFCNIQQRFIRAKFGISNYLQSPYIGENSDGSISDFRISGQSLINKTCHNSRTSDDNDMKLGPVTKFYNKNTEA